MVEELHDYDRANAWRPSPGLVFRVIGEPRVNAAAIIVEGELTNESDVPREVIYFSGLSLRPLGDVLRLRTDLPPRPPPVPPPPMRIELEWSFLYWTGDKPTGRVSLVLP